MISLSALPQTGVALHLSLHSSPLLSCLGGLCVVLSKGLLVRSAEEKERRESDALGWMIDQVGHEGITRTRK